MSTATASTPGATHPHTSLGRLSFPRVVRSEWIKLRSLRSTFWTVSSAVVLVVGIATLAAIAIPGNGGQAEGAQEAGTGLSAVEVVPTAASAGLGFASLIIAVLGVLAISGEFGTGMIRSSFTAVPRRLPVLMAKTLVLFLVAFSIGLVSAALSWAVAITTLHGKGYDAAFTPDTLWSILGSATYLGLVAVFALGVGATLRSTAGGIAAALGVLLVLPTIMSLINFLARTQWLIDAQQVLLSNVGLGMAGGDNGQTEPWVNVVAALVWAATSLIVGAIAVQRRDI